jgi:hypothetical protein
VRGYQSGTNLARQVDGPAAGIMRPMSLMQCCGVPGCPRVQVEPYCADHASTIPAKDGSGKRRKGRQRASVASGGEGYDRRWMKLRFRTLRRDPICEWPDCDHAAEHVHHSDGLGCRWPRGADMGNLMSLCASHPGSTLKGFCS